MSEQEQIVLNQVLLKWDAAHSILVMNPKNPSAGYYQIFMFPPSLHSKKGSLCSGLCGHSLKRFHFSCLRCRLRRVFFGEMKNPVPVTPYVILLRKRTEKTFLTRIIKHWLTVLEFLDNL
jgi:hypothetical protein